MSSETAVALPLAASNGLVQAQTARALASAGDGAAPTVLAPRLVPLRA